MQAKDSSDVAFTACIAMSLSTLIYQKLDCIHLQKVAQLGLTLSGSL